MDPARPLPESRVQEALRFAHELADLADAVTLPSFRLVQAHGAESPDLEAPGSPVPIERKADGSPVTEADRDAERVMRRAIRQRHPDHAVLGEEDGLLGSQDAPTWILDPIDGTKNFIRGVPVFGTLIALALEGKGVLGVISAPALGTRWDGVPGGVARQDGREIRVSSVEDLADAHVSFGGLNYFVRRGGPDLVTRLTTRTARQRGFGDFWQHCLVASGGVDVALEAEVSRWDLAAPKVLVEAAGGRFTSLEGEDTDSGGSALATNGRLHEEVLALIHRFAGEG